jgi:ribosomal protein S8
MSILSLHFLLSKLSVGLSNFRILVLAKFSIFNLGILKFLQRQGYVGSFSISLNFQIIKIFLRYSGVTQLFYLGNFVSKPAHRILISTKRAQFFLNNHKLSSHYLISTSFGFFFGDEVVKYAFGGEILFYFS